MKFIGQYIQSFIARFRNDVYLEDIDTGTIASGGHLGLDSNNKIVKAVDGGGDLTSIVAGTGLSGTSLTGPIPTLNLAITDLSTVTPTSGDFLATLDGNTPTHQKTSTDNLATLFAGTGLTASSAVISVDASQTQITGVGTIESGVWNGTAIATAYIADDSITEHKLDNTLLSQIEANTIKATNVSTNLGRITGVASIIITSSDGDNVTIGEASSSIAGLMNVTHHDKLDGIETGATADQSSAEILTAIEDGVDSVHYVNGSIDTAHIADDQVTFAKAQGVTPNVFDNKIKLIPSDFMANDDGGNTKFGIGYVDDGGANTYGMRAANAATELYAFVSIPQGMKATHVDIHDKNNLAVEVFEVQIDGIAMTSKGSGNANTTIDITDVASTATNFLAIRITVATFSGGSGDRIYGGTVTVAII